MNSFFLMFLLIFIGFSQTIKAQSFDNAINAIRSGNASALAAHFSSNVEVSIKGTEASYSKAQAEMVIKNFFATQPPKSFSVVHQGTSPEGSKYFIGTLTTSGTTYRTYVYAKPQGNMLVIQEIRFEVQ